MVVELVDSIIIGNAEEELPHNRYVFNISKITRALLQEVARSRSLSPTVKSSRYTLHKDLKQEKSFGFANNDDRVRARQYVKFTGDRDIDDTSIQQLELLRKMVVLGKSNDIVKYNIPECYFTNLTWSVSYNDFIHLAKLRLHKSALKEYRELLYRMISSMPYDKTLYDLRDNLTTDLLLR